MIGLWQKSALGRAACRCSIARAPDEFAFRTASGREGASVTLSAIDLDAETLRRCLRLGGLEISGARATLLLPAVSALLAGCDRLAALDLSTAGGCGPNGGWGDR
jgi:hypothetical protein